MKKYLIRLLVFVLIVGALVLTLRFTEAGEFIRPENIENNKEQLIGQVEQHYGISVALYILLYVVVVAVSIPGAAVLSVLGGFFFGNISGLFGVALTVVYINVGATTGAFLLFLAARFFLGDMVFHRYGKRLTHFQKELEENGKNYLLTMRFIPIFPFWMINLLAGVAKVGPGTFIWTTALGIIPGSAVFAYIGYAFGSVGGEAQEVVGNMVFAFLALGLISILPVILKKIRARSIRRKALA